MNDDILMSHSLHIFMWLYTFNPLYTNRLSILVLDGDDDPMYISELSLGF